MSDYSNTNGWRAGLGGDRFGTHDHPDPVRKMGKALPTLVLNSQGAESEVTTLCRERARSGWRGAEFRSSSNYIYFPDLESQSTKLRSSALLPPAVI